MLGPTIRKLVQLGCLAAITAPAASAETVDSGESWATVLGTDITADYSDPKFRSFDFWIGEWDANWRRQADGEFYHAPEGNWTHNRVFPILGGKALMEVVWSRDKPDQPSQRGLSIRYFDTGRERWVMSQYWPNENTSGWAMLDQLIGDARHGRISMYSAVRRGGLDEAGTDEHRRYNFTDIRPGRSFRWDGANTGNFGRSWFTWAISEMHRVADVEPFGVSGTPFSDVRNEHLCRTEPHGAFEFMQGEWRGELDRADDTSEPARLVAGKILDGCAVAAIVDVAGKRTLLTFAYSDPLKLWFNYRLDDDPASTHTYFVSDSATEGAAFREARNLNIEDEFTHFVTREKLGDIQSIRRTILQELSPDRIVLREEYRATSAGDWRLLETYRLTKVR